MKTHSVEAKENTNHTGAIEFSQERGKDKSSNLFPDHRSASVIQASLIDVANNNDLNESLTGLQEMADQSPSAKRINQLPALISNSPKLNRLRSFQEMANHKTDRFTQKINETSHSPVLQPKGPRNYAKTFKEKKDEMMEWLKKSELIGLDLSADEEATEEENTKIGWHHQYPYSHLWEHHGHHALADHGANLKLGPMKNRFGDPGHEIDISYSKAKKKEKATSNRDITPSYSPLGKTLFEELRDHSQAGTGSDTSPTTDIDIKKIKHNDYKNEVLNEKTNKEEYWSEWYLSDNMRQVMLSDSKIEAQIKEINILAISQAKDTIIKTLNQKLDSLRYSYATHTPSKLEKGEISLAPFQTEPIVETGIPSSKLNKKGILSELLVEGQKPCYADLVHQLLVEKKWVTRGSQGEAHDLAVEFREKMKKGNSKLIVDLLKADSLSQLKSAAEIEYKNNVLRSLPKLDDLATNQEGFFKAIEEVQKLNFEISKEDIENLIEKFLSPLNITKIERTEVEPEDSAESFVPKYYDKGEELTLLKEAYDEFIINGDFKEKVRLVACNIIELNAQERYKEHVDRDWIYTWDGEVVITPENLKECFDPFIKVKTELKKESKKTAKTKKSSSKKGRKEKGSDDEAQTPDKTEGFAVEVIRALSNMKENFKENWQEPGETEEKVSEMLTKTQVYDFFNARMKTTGKQYKRHLDAINDPEKRGQYAGGIESALRQPGKGYDDPALKYPLPKAISEAKEGSSWDFEESVELGFKADWHKIEFSAFLKKFIASKEVQESLL